MGYAPTNTVIFGIILTTQQVQEIFADKLKQAERKDECIGDYFFHIIPNSDLEMKPSTYRPDDRSFDDKRFYVEMQSPGADSRINSLTFQPQVSDIHYFGIYCAANGYGCWDDIMMYIRNVPQKAKENWQKYCAPILAKHGVFDKPDAHICNQVH